MIPNRFRDPALRTMYFKKREPNTSIPPCTKEYWGSNDVAVRICDLEDGQLGTILIQMRESAMVTRAMKIASMLDINLPKSGPARDKLLNEFMLTFKEDWTKFLPTYYYDLDREAQRRGLWWNELTSDQHKRLQVEFETSIMAIIKAGISAFAKGEDMKRGRASRNIAL